MSTGLSIPERSGSLCERLEAANQYDIIRLSLGEVVFAPGTEKHERFFWIVQGQIKVRWPSIRGGADVIELLGVGQYFGLGFLDHHVCGAAAAKDAAVQIMATSSARHIVENDFELKRREAIETEREFIHRRETLIASASQALPQRLAAFLAFISRLNTYEGRDPMVISDDINCRVVAEYLKSDIESLSKAIRQLSELGAVELAPPASLRIRDLDFLEYIAGSEDKVCG